MKEWRERLNLGGGELENKKRVMGGTTYFKKGVEVGGKRHIALTSEEKVWGQGYTGGGKVRENNWCTSAFTGESRHI